MKPASLSLALFLAACVSPPVNRPATAGSLAPAREEEEILLAVQEAVEKGYKVVTERGETLYCGRI